MVSIYVFFFRLRIIFTIKKHTCSLVCFLFFYRFLGISYLVMV
nr:MAG TPA: hypothetical protein [Caudoviricetes sp.]